MNLNIVQGDSSSASESLLSDASAAPAPHLDNPISPGPYRSRDYRAGAGVTVTVTSDTRATVTGANESPHQWLTGPGQAIIRDSVTVAVTGTAPRAV